MANLSYLQNNFILFSCDFTPSFLIHEDAEKVLHEAKKSWRIKKVPVGSDLIHHGLYLLGQIAT